MSSNSSLYLYMLDGGLFRLSRDSLTGYPKRPHVKLPTKMQRIIIGSECFFVGGEIDGGVHNFDIYCLQGGEEAPSICLPDPDSPIRKLVLECGLDTITDNPPIIETIEEKIYILETVPNPCRRPKTTSKNQKPPVFRVFDPIISKSAELLDYPPHLTQSWEDHNGAFLCSHSVSGHKLIVSSSSGLWFYDTQQQKWVHVLHGDDCFIAVAEYDDFFIGVDFPEVVSLRLDSDRTLKRQVVHELYPIVGSHGGLDSCFMGRIDGGSFWYVLSNRDIEDPGYMALVAFFEVSIEGNSILSARLLAKELCSLGGFDVFSQMCHSERLYSAFLLQHSSSQSFRRQRNEQILRSLRGRIDYPTMALRSQQLMPLRSQSFMPPSAEELFEEWVAPLRSVEDIHKRFRRLCLKEVHSSCGFSTSELECIDKINANGFLTISYHPAINGDKFYSCELDVSEGIIFQKARLDFFCSKERLDALIDRCNALPNLTYMAENRRGAWKWNITCTSLILVTWGCVPGGNIIKHSFMDPEKFTEGSEESFELWSEWASYYREEEFSKKLLEEVHNNLFLVTVIDNDYQNCSLFRDLAGIQCFQKRGVDMRRFRPHKARLEVLRT